MNFADILLACITVIEFVNVMIKLYKLKIDEPPPLDEEMIKRLYA